jgi:8-oxo-dGTP diphosphatase
VQTLEPLAELLGVEVEPDERLAEGAGADGPLALADELQRSAAVLCSHGDVIPDLLEVLVHRGVKLRDDLRWQKASTWVFTRDGGQLAKGRYLPPPA